MAHNDVCKIEVTKEVERRKKISGSIQKAIIAVSKDFDIPEGTIHRWYFPSTDYKPGSTRSGTPKIPPKNEKKENLGSDFKGKVSITYLPLKQYIPPPKKMTKSEKEAEQERRKQEWLKENTAEIYNQEDISPDFKSAWEQFLKEIQKEKKSNWTPERREGVRKCLDVLEMVAFYESFTFRTL